MTDDQKVELSSDGTPCNPLKSPCKKIKLRGAMLKYVAKGEKSGYKTRYSKISLGE